jgi:hypothetical protein
VAKRKRAKPKLPPLTPRGREIVTLVINSVAFGRHADEAQLGAVADQIGTTRGRLNSMLRRLEGWLTVERGLLVPTVAALLWQDSRMTEPEAAAVRRKLVAAARRA